MGRGRSPVRLLNLLKASVYTCRRHVRIPPLLGGVPWTEFRLIVSYMAQVSGMPH